MSSSSERDVDNRELLQTTLLLPSPFGETREFVEDEVEGQVALQQGSSSSSELEHASKVHCGMELLRLALPVSLSNALYFALSLINIGFVGRLGEFSLAVSVLSTVLFNVTGLAVIQGFNISLESLCGKTYGSRDYKTVGLHAQRAFILNGVLGAIILLLWEQLSEKAFLLLRQDPEVAAAAARYMHVMSPALLMNGLFEILKRYLSCQNIVRPMYLATGLSLMLSPAINWGCIYGLDLGLDGAALTFVILSAVMAISLTGMTIFIDYNKLDEEKLPVTWPGWSWHVMSGYTELLRLAVPGFFMVVSEWLAFEFLVILAGFTPKSKVSVASMGILLNISGTVWTIVNGISFAASMLVARAVGAGCHETAGTYGWMAVVCSTTVELTSAFLFMISRDSIGAWFTSSADVIATISHAMPFFIMSLPGDGINCSLQGVLRGTGSLRLGAIINIGSYWILGAPLAFFLGLHRHLGVPGLWASMAVTNTWLGILMTIVTLYFWNRRGISHPCLS